MATVVDEEVAFGPENLGVPRAEIMERVDRNPLTASAWKNIKSARRTCFRAARSSVLPLRSTLAMHPKMIIFDEATAMLDPKGREDILKIIRRLNAQGMTILLITHFMEEAVDADQVVV